MTAAYGEASPPLREGGCGCPSAAATIGGFSSAADAGAGLSFAALDPAVGRLFELAFFSGVGLLGGDETWTLSGSGAGRAACLSRLAATALSPEADVSQLHAENKQDVPAGGWSESAFLFFCVAIYQTSA